MKTRLLLLPFLLALILTPDTLFAQIQEPDLRAKIGQMIMTGFGNSDEAADSLSYDIRKRNLGGLLFFAGNLRFPSQIRAQNKRLQDQASTPMLMATDQEGGIVARLDENNGYTQTYTAYELGYVFDSEDSTRAQAALMAGWMHDAGFNMNLAPVVDVNVNPDSPAIGGLDRSYSDDPVKVFDHASWTIDEFHSRNISTSLKHFPGHGSAVDDSHFGFTDITDTWQEKELTPFSMLIEDGYDDAVMTGHLFNRNWDSEYPASLSHYTITTMLRDSLGFEGVVISDELFMRAIQDNYGLDEAVIQAVNAGTDILLFSTNLYNNRSLPGYLIELIYDSVQNGIIEEETIDLAYTRIMKLKEQRSVVGTDNEGPDLPRSISISNYPNPFNPSTNIQFTLMKASEVEVRVVNSLGQTVQTVHRGRMNAGVHTFRFVGSSLASGMYLVEVAGNGFRSAHKMLLLK